MWCIFSEQVGEVVLSAGGVAGLWGHTTKLVETRTSQPRIHSKESPTQRKQEEEMEEKEELLVFKEMILPDILNW